MLAVAALSARTLVEAAALDGLRTLALDVFGDLDTCRAAVRWEPIGSGLRIDEAQLIGALDGLAAAGEAGPGWIAGSGFEGRLDLLERAAARLPLIGTAAVDLRRLHDPRRFFAFLDAHAIEHPPVRFDGPGEADGWLFKGAEGFGGTQVWRSRPAAMRDGDGYWQQERAGTAMSATFVANADEAVVLGFNLQFAHARGARPFLFSGLAGPVAVADKVRRGVAAALARLVPEFRLLGLGSLDFVLVDGRPELLEVNARVPASVALYPRVGTGGPMRAHLRACLENELPPKPRRGVLRGFQIVHARRRLMLDTAAAARLASTPALHDIPRPGSSFDAGDPLCTLSARGSDPAALRAGLDRRRDELLDSLETRS
ncbi:MAG: ATP-grasp domain-containing protein [Burkholderiales bacterium]|nr:ATP-grasp domain-containing protein [Burkholderiales bacterium]MDE2455705.1 ATP-grasp domain-containing protein [Burkholderiales bacterium]